jgi:hypothetical protein
LKKGKPWKWQDSHEKSFQALQKAFATAPVFATYDYDRKTVLETDAFDWASEEVLSQLNDQKILKPVVYFSAKHSAAECNYEIYNKKLLAIIKCLEEWRPEFQGTNKSFGILINYKNLKYFTITKSLNQRQIRWSEFLAGFNFKITYRPGNKAIRPDAFSRRTQDCPTKANPEDDRVKNRKRRILGPKAFDSAIFTEFFNDNNLTAAPAELILPDYETPSTN